MAKLSYFNRHVKLILKFYKQNDLNKDYKEVVYEHYIPLNDIKKYNEVYNNVRISFEIEKYPSNGIDTNGKAKIMIYNISDDVNKDLSNESIIKRVDLQVGYGDKTETIFYGMINTAYVSYKNNDMITYLWGFNLTNTELKNTAEKTYPLKNLNPYSIHLNTILDDIKTNTGGKKFEVNTKGLDEETREAFQKKGFQNRTVVGLKGILDMISKDLSCDYYIENKVIYFCTFKNKGGLGVNEKDGLIVISPKNGLLNDPNVLDSGLEVRCILNPKIKMFSPIKIESAFVDYSGDSYYITDFVQRYNARYKDKGFMSFYNYSKVLFVTHLGDTHENLWETKFTTLSQNDTINPNAIKAL